VNFSGGAKRYINVGVWAVAERTTRGSQGVNVTYGLIPTSLLRIICASCGTDLKSAADWAELHARHGQEIYVHNYNLRSRDKHLSEGDMVIVLNDEASGKFGKHWQGPVTVLRVKSPYSYLVDMGDGRVRNVHANKMIKI